MNIEEDGKFGINEILNTKFTSFNNVSKMKKSGFIFKSVFIFIFLIILFPINSVITKTKNNYIKTFLQRKSIDFNKNDREFLSKLKLFLDKDEIMENEMMYKHTTFELGGPAKFFIKPKSINKIIKVLQLCKEYSVEFFVLGNGSNLLVSDHGYDGIIIK